MGKKFDQLAFILGMKKNKYPQAIGSLFMLDAKTGDLYACALGQGLLDTVMDETDVRRQLKTVSDEELDTSFVIIDGKPKEVEVRISSDLEEQGNEFLNEFNFPARFTGFITDRNDDNRLPIPEIAAMAREEFGIE